MHLKHDHANQTLYDRNGDRSSLCVRYLTSVGTVPGTNGATDMLGQLGARLSRQGRMTRRCAKGAQFGLRTSSGVVACEGTTGTLRCPKRPVSQSTFFRCNSVDAPPLLQKCRGCSAPRQAAHCTGEARSEGRNVAVHCGAPLTASTTTIGAPGWCGWCMQRPLPGACESPHWGPACRCP